MTGQIYFRQATFEDASGIAALVNRVFTPASVPGWSLEALASVCHEHSETSLQSALQSCAYQRVAIADGRVVAHLIFSKPHLLSIMAVVPEAQGKGLGSRLIVDAIGAVDKGYPNIEVLRVNATERSMPFYAKHGFYPISPMLNVESRRFIRMALWLRPRRMGW